MIHTTPFALCKQIQTPFPSAVCRCEDGRLAAERACQEMSDNLRRITQDRQSVDLRTAAELDDLYRTKINLEERLVELIRFKQTYIYSSMHRQ